MKEGLNKKTGELHVHLTGENLEVEDAGVGELIGIGDVVYEILKVCIVNEHPNVTGRPGKQAVNYIVDEIS